MSERFNQLRARHSRLLARCAVEREELAGTAEEIEAELGRIDRGISAVRRVVSNPAVIVGGIAILALLGPRRLLGWAARGAMLYTSARRLAQLPRETRG